MLLLNMPPPVEGIKHRQDNIKLLIHQELYGPGTLYIAERLGGIGYVYYSYMTV